MLFDQVNLGGKTGEPLALRKLFTVGSLSQSDFRGIDVSANGFDLRRDAETFTTPPSGSRG
jgi:hypothetical protein